MMAHYLQAGILPEQIMRRSRSEKLFFYAAMLIAREEEVEKYKALLGGDR